MVSTQFSDLTTSEFTQQYLGLFEAERELLLKGIPVAPNFSTNALPAAYDWRQHGAVTSVKKQCIRRSSTWARGCNAGHPLSAFPYIKSAGGIEKESDYPYTGRVGTCKFNTNKTAASVDRHALLPRDEDQISVNLVKFGPVSVAIDVEFLKTYRRGSSCPSISWRSS
ncbi:hypothetical protein Patl1_09233 [Pistacia atlantica]|uniref:Uncharacterized protein n=1 Tax=Pistacia atlantica TaxID=434234 RepID=A0ACC1AI52_9ROSI|nr:hypothetical protein Patl1_09233 [Pistacia atlantica]